MLQVSLLIAISLAAPRAQDAAASPDRLSGSEFRFERRSGLVYAEREGPALRLDLYVPDCEGPHPAALVIHGGGWKTGGRAILDAAVLARALAREGIAAASISYRLAPQSDHPAQIEDCRAAFDWLQEHADDLALDRERIAAVGASAGGHLAALLGTQQRPPPAARPKCVVAICAPFDLLPVPGKAAHSIQIECVADLLGLDEVDDIANKLALLQQRGRDASPLHRVSAGDVPMLMIDGAKDWVVEPRQAERMAEALTAAGVRHEHFRLEDGGHCEFLLAGSRDWTTEPPSFWRATRRFLRRELLGVR